MKTTRRRFLQKVSLSSTGIIIGANSLSNFSSCTRRKQDELLKQRELAKNRKRRIILNNDGNDYPSGKVTPESFLNARTNGLEQTQVDSIFYCTGVFNLYSTEVFNELTEVEKSEGWILLFDGETLKGWRGVGRDVVPEDLWKVENGTIRNVGNGEVASIADGQPANGGDLMTTGTFDNFELYFEWKIDKAGNTGLKYNVSEEMSLLVEPKYSALGFEYQLLDDADPEYKEEGPTHLSGALYDLIPAENKLLKPVGEYNSSRILVCGNHVEHWLNEIRVLEFEFGSERLDSLCKKSKYCYYTGFTEKRKGHIVLQNHKDDAWFRNIKIRVF